MLLSTLATGLQAQTRTLYTGRGFAGAAPAWLGGLAKQAGITDYENLGRQALGGLKSAAPCKVETGNRSGRMRMVMSEWCARGMELSLGS